MADVALLRAEPGAYGQVASDPTVSRAFAALATEAPAALKAINTARAAARSGAWTLAGTAAPDHDANPTSVLIIDLDATLVTSHGEKENARPAFKRGFGLHPLTALVDHGAEGTGEPWRTPQWDAVRGLTGQIDTAGVLRSVPRSYDPASRV